MKLIAFGSNLPGPLGGRRAMCRAALDKLPGVGITVLRISPVYESEPYPPSEQTWYINGVAEIATEYPPAKTVACLLAVEAELGRERTEKNAARSIDLDLIAYDRVVMDSPVTVPHPRMAERNFVLQPLNDLAPVWRHPVSGQTPDAMLKSLKRPGELRKLAETL